MSHDRPTILLVEDNEDDVFIMEHALRRAGIEIPLHVARDGQVAMEYLAGSGRYSNRNEFPLPSMVFLDLKLPYVHGFEVLEWIRTQEVLNSLWVIVLTSSDEEKDHQRARALGARSYLVKPPRTDALLKLFDSLRSDRSSLGAPPFPWAPKKPAD